MANVKLEIKPPLARITIDRPEKMNALNLATIAELEQAFATVAAEAAVRAVVVTGAGEKAFVAGADIGELAALDPIAGREYGRRGQALFRAIELSPKPVIAAINGHALGGGLELALACSFRIAAEHAKLGQPEVKLGLIPGYGGTQRLPRLIGAGRALEMLLTGEPITAAAALACGLVNAIVPAAELLSRAEALAAKAAANAPLAVRLCLEAVRRGLEMNLEEGLYLESSLFALCCGTADMKEGTRAFVEKRAARFEGR
ncbi:MAG: enoyl-CoA hydratase/isomerase family protein [Terriglobales bacterium]